MSKAIILVVALFAWVVAPAAAAGSAALGGTVVANGKPVPSATVAVRGNNVVLRAVTDQSGRFTFGSLELGSYVVSADGAGGTAVANVDLASGGATLRLELEPLRDIGRVTASVRSPPIHGGGTDLSLNSTALQRAPTNGSFSETLIQLPGAVRGANGVVHLNGDHGVINYVIDGVPIPQALNRELGSEIDPNDVSFVDVAEGAWPAQYGLRFGSSLNISTRAGGTSSGFDGAIRMGSYTNLDTTLGYHTPLAGGGGLDAAIRAQQSTRGLDPPDLSSPHNDASNTNEFLRVAFPHGANSFTDLTVVHSYRTYQIPNDVDNGEPASTGDGERQEDTFVNLRFHEQLGPQSELSFGPALKVSHIRDFGDPNGDFAYGEALNVEPAPFGNGGTSTDCATAYHPGAIDSSYVPTTCAFSLHDDKTATDYILQSDYVATAGRHEFRAGASYDLTTVSKLYAVTLQPGNFLAPLVTPSTPDAPATVIDRDPNLGTTIATYVQDTWRLGDAYALDYGLRYDTFSIASTGFRQGFGSFSPRVKFTRFFGTRASVYVYAGRLFEPFSFENVSPRAAQLLNLPLQPSFAQFDLKPERDTFLEAGGHLPLAGGSLGLRVWQKNANDLIDDTQVGVTLLHQDINYVLGRISQEALYYEHPLIRNGRGYLSVAHTVSLNKGCETQLLAPCFGSPTDFTPADHDQTYSVTGGIEANDARGGWFSIDGEYGSGLSSDICPEPVVGNCKRTPHTIFSLQKGVPLGPAMALTGEVDNLLNDRYYVTVLNAQGNHYAPPRQFSVGLKFGR
jgi:hypothetical protein